MRRDSGSRPIADSRVGIPENRFIIKGPPLCGSVALCGSSPTGPLGLRSGACRCRSDTCLFGSDRNGAVARLGRRCASSAGRPLTDTSNPVARGFGPASNPKEGRDMATETGKTKAQRVPSTIQFPYTDMSDAIAVAEGLLKGGGTPMSRDQLAAAMDLAPGGGGFATKLGTARMFGVMEGAAGTYQLSDLGFEIVDPGRQKEARVKAFLNVELFKRTYDEFRGKLLPPRPHGLEAAFMNFGVTKKNVQDARRAFEKSARLAGMY